MVNVTLFISSIIFGSIHILFMILFPSFILLMIILILGIITSIWNHGSSDELSKWCDRILILTGVFIDLYFIAIIIEYHPNCYYLFLLILLAIVFYLNAKLCNYFSIQKYGNLFHLFAHLSATICHCTMFYYLNLIFK